MATLNAVIVPAKVLKGGRHKIRISIAHNGETRYILTNIVIDSTKEFRNGAVTKRPDAAILNTKLRKLLQQYQERIDDIPYTAGLSCAELVYHLTHRPEVQTYTLHSLFEEFVDLVKKETTASMYKQQWRTLSKIIDCTVKVQNITPLTISKLEKDLNKHEYSNAYKTMLINLLQMILNYAKRNEYVKFKIDPFTNYKRPKLIPRKAWLSVEEIKAIRDCDKLNKPQRKCRDLFMLSYYLGGINIVDLLNINLSNSTKMLRYIRTKTKDLPKNNNEVCFEIPEEAKYIIKKYTDSSGRLDITESQRKERLSSFFCIHLNHIAKIVGIENTLIYYSARKSFSQHAFALGINTSVIDYILGHSLSSKNTIYSYIYVTPQMATEAIRKVLDNLK